MLITEHEKVKGRIRQLADKYGHDRSALIPILQDIQAEYYCINELAMQEVADLLGIHPVEVYGVVSFYAFLGTQAKGRFVVRLCRTITCDMAGKDRVARQLQNDLGIEFGQSTPDGKFTLQWANCLGMCDQGPAMLVNDQVFTRVTPQKVHDIIEGCRRTFASYTPQHKEEHLV